MASTIKLKSSTTAGNAPSSLETGEFAINVKDGNLFYGSSSAVKQHFVVDELEVKGNLTAQQYIVSSSVTYTTQSFSSGSTAFGDSADDTHVFTGAITASSNISASGTITGNSIVGTVGTATQGTIDHDSLANFVANEHIDHSGVSITAGDGLTGGGTIASTRTLAVGAGTGVTVNSNDVAIGQDVATTANVQFANITGSAISASGTITAATLDAAAVSDTLAAAIVAEIDNDEIPIAKLAEDAVTVTAGTNLGGGGSVTLGGSITLNVDDAFIKNDADDATTGILTAAGLKSTTHITSSGNISASGDLLGVEGQFSSQVKIKGEVALSTTDSATTGQVFVDTQITKIKIGKAGAITSTLLESNVTASGDISASGNFLGAQFKSHGKTIGLYHAASDTIRLADSSIPIKVYGTSIDLTEAPVTASIISASGTIFTDTLSSPSNDLQIPSDTVTITAGTAGDANLILHADTDNNDENDNPYMYYKQDGDGGVFGIIGLSGANDKWPDGTTLTGATANGMVIGMTGSASGTARQVTIAAGNSASIVVKNDADVQMLESLIVDNNISASGDLISNTLDTKTNKLAVTSTVHGNHQGDVVFFGGTTSMDVGQIYNLNGAGGWTKAQANSQANSDALLAVALGAASDTNGMLLKGMVTLDHDPGTIGDPLYLSDGTAGQATSTAPDSTNDIVRLIGYCVDSTNGQIYFNPSNDFIVHA
ncbi:hypothetical protein OAA40_00345 [bacterium]|nr:hypothetical protein [bacterium]